MPSSLVGYPVDGPGVPPVIASTQLAWPGRSTGQVISRKLSSPRFVTTKRRSEPSTARWWSTPYSMSWARGSTSVNDASARPCESVVVFFDATVLPCREMRIVILWLGWKPSAWTEKEWPCSTLDGTTSTCGRPTKI